MEAWLVQEERVTPRNPERVTLWIQVAVSVSGKLTTVGIHSTD